MGRFLERIINTLRTESERREVATAEATLGSLDSESVADVLGIWENRHISRAKERLFDLLRGPAERDRAFKVRAILEGDTAGMRRIQESLVQEYAAVMSRKSSKIVDLSTALVEFRESMGWPAHGTLRGLPEVTEDVSDLFEELDALDGKVSAERAAEIIAILDSEGIEAKYVDQRRKVPSQGE